MPVKSVLAEGVGLIGLTLDPLPDLPGPARIHIDDDVLVRDRGSCFLDLALRRIVGNGAARIRLADIDHHSAFLSHGIEPVAATLDWNIQRLRFVAIPSQLLDEKVLEVEALEILTGAAGV